MGYRVFQWGWLRRFPWQIPGVFDMLALDAIKALDAVFAVNLSLHIQIHRTEVRTLAAVVAACFYLQGNY